MSVVEGLVEGLDHRLAKMIPGLNQRLFSAFHVGKAEPDATAHFPAPGALQSPGSVSSQVLRLACKLAGGVKAHQIRFNMNASQFSL
jgi:hypothetical protein